MSLYCLISLAMELNLIITQIIIKQEREQELILEGSKSCHDLDLDLRAALALLSISTNKEPKCKNRLQHCFPSRSSSLIVLQ